MPNNTIKHNIYNKYILFVLLMISTTALSGCFGKPKNFTVDELTITLSVDFVERKNPDFNLYLSCDDIVFSAKKETSSDLEKLGFEIKSLKDYGSEILAQNNVPVSSLVSHNNYYYFTITETNSGAQYTYVHFIFENNKDYWMCNFVCKSKDYSRLKKRIFQWADTVTFS